MGFPFEVVTMVGSAAFSGLMSMWSMSIKSKAAQQSALIQSANASANFTQAAREHGLREPRFAVTRQIIALTAVFFIIAFPKIYPIVVLWMGLPYEGMVYGWTEFNPSWLPWGSGKEVLVWKEVYGLAITPMDTHLLSAIIGFYFGQSIARH